MIRRLPFLTWMCERHFVLSEQLRNDLSHLKPTDVPAQTNSRPGAEDKVGIIHLLQLLFGALEPAFWNEGFGVRENIRISLDDPSIDTDCTYDVSYMSCIPFCNNPYLWCQLGYVVRSNRPHQRVRGVPSKDLQKDAIASPLSSLLLNTADGRLPL